MLVHFGRQAKKRDTQKTMNFVHLQKGRRNSNIKQEKDFMDNYNIKAFGENIVFGKTVYLFLEETEAVLKEGK